MAEETKKSFPRRSASIAAVVIFLAGVLAGFPIVRYMDARQIDAEQKFELHGGQYGLVNPLLECTDGGAEISKELVPFKDKIEEFVENKIKEGKAASVAVYFRDLNNGPWFGIDEKEEFMPGSLLKIPILMAYLKMSELNPAILENKLRFESPAFATNQFIPPRDPLMPGGTYSVKELLFRMIVYSDNYAAWLLDSADKENIKGGVYADLGLPLPVEQGYTLSVKRYAAFFRILFNASYLNNESSNIALRLLSSAEFRDGLVAGVPQGVTVAHKFGERLLEGGKQFHDCGIVYYPQHPYLLCIMTRGENFSDLITTIADVSRLTYEEVDAQMKSPVGN